MYVGHLYLFRKTSFLYPVLQEIDFRVALINDGSSVDGEVSSLIVICIMWPFNLISLQVEFHDFLLFGLETVNSPNEISEM